MTKVLIGADPEVFVRNPNSGVYVSAHGLIAGDKKNPQRVDFGAVQVDGMALEFNIDPAENADQFVHNVRQVYNTLCGMVPGYDVLAEPAITFDQQYFNEQPAEAKVLGCDPDFDAWTGEANSPPVSDQPMRTASGHVHIGWGSGFDVTDPVHLDNCRVVCRQLDYVLGVASLSYDPDNRRRSMYGRAGAFRPKPYGVEYRTLSNAWLRSEPLMRFVYQRAFKGATTVIEGGDLFEDTFGDIARNIINENIVDWKGTFPELAEALAA